VHRVHRRNSFLSLEIREVSLRKTLIELLNTLLAQQGVLEQEFSKRALTSLQGEKGTKLLNTLEEYLCKECIRSNTHMKC
jgi:hypothetical protein